MLQPHRRSYNGGADQKCAAQSSSGGRPCDVAGVVTQEPVNDTKDGARYRQGAESGRQEERRQPGLPLEPPDRQDSNQERDEHGSGLERSVRRRIPIAEAEGLREREHEGESGASSPYEGHVPVTIGESHRERTRRDILGSARSRAVSAPRGPRQKRQPRRSPGASAAGCRLRTSGTATPRRAAESLRSVDPLVEGRRTSESKFPYFTPPQSGGTPSCLTPARKQVDNGSASCQCLLPLAAYLSAGRDRESAPGMNRTCARGLGNRCSIH